MEANENIIEALIEALAKRRNEQKNNNGGAMVPYQGESLPSIHRPGFFERLFDPSAAKKEEFEQKQLDIILATRLKTMAYQATRYAETIRIDEEAQVRHHERERREQDEVQTRYIKARAEIQKHTLQQNLLVEIADLQLDPMEEQLLIAKIIRILMTPNGKENPNGQV